MLLPRLKSYDILITLPCLFFLIENIKFKFSEFVNSFMSNSLCKVLSSTPGLSNLATFSINLFCTFKSCISSIDIPDLESLRLPSIESNFSVTICFIFVYYNHVKWHYVLSCGKT